MTTASDWLKSPNRNYADGIELLKQLDPKDKYLTFLSTEKPTEFQSGLLRERITRCVRLGKQARIENKAEVTGANKTVNITKGKGNKPAVEDEKQRPVIDDNPIVRYEDLPTEYQQKYDAAKSSGRKLAALKEALNVAPNDAERADIGKQLETIEDEKNKLWGEIDAWWNANKGKPATDNKPGQKQNSAPKPKGNTEAKSNPKGKSKPKSKKK